MLSNGEGLHPPASKSRVIQVYVLFLIVAPTLLDFIFIDSKIARLARVVTAVIILSICWARRKEFFSNRLGGESILILTFALYLIGTFSAIVNSGDITPNVLSLLIFVLIAIGNRNNLNYLRDGIGTATGYICVLSSGAIFLALNPRGIFLSSEGYPTILPNVGIPGRNLGIMSHPNSLGQVAAISIIYALTGKKRLVILYPSVFCLLKSGSRTAISAVLVVIILLLIKKMKPKKLEPGRKFNFSQLIILFFIGMQISGTIVLLLNLNDFSPESLTGRARIWQTAQELFSTKLLFGLGWGWETRAIETNLLSVWAVSAHNALLEVLFSTGFVGLLVFLYFFSTMMIGVFRVESIDQGLILSLTIFGVSESIVDLQYPNLTTFLFLFVVIASRQGIKNYEK